MSYVRQSLAGIFARLFKNYCTYKQTYAMKLLKN